MPVSDAPEVPGREFIGQRIAVSYNLGRCGPTRRKKSAYCFTVRDGACRSTAGKVLAYTDTVLLQNVEFCLNERGRDEIRAGKARYVHAWVVGTARDPRKHPDLIGDVDGWSRLNYCPQVDDAFVYDAGMMVDGAGNPTRVCDHVKRKSNAGVLRVKVDSKGVPVLRSGRFIPAPGKPLKRASWVYFDTASGKALVRRPGAATRNPSDLGEFDGDPLVLSVLAGMIGGDVDCGE